VLALVENIDTFVVDAEALGRGITLAEFYAGEALRLFEATSLSPILATAEKLRQWLHYSWPEPFISLRAIIRLGPNSLRTAAQAKSAVAILLEHGWLEEAGAGVVEGARVTQSWRVIRDVAP
jgi:hypothetical protein